MVLSVKIIQSKLNDIISSQLDIVFWIYNEIIEVMMANVIGSSMKQIGMVCLEGVLPEDKKWCQPCIWIEYACRQWDNWTYTQEAFFSFPWGEGGGWIFFNSCISIMLPACPHIFPRFPMCSSRILPITPHFIPYPFAQISFPLLTYGVVETAILGSLLNSCLFVWRGNQNGSLQK